MTLLQLVWLFFFLKMSYNTVMLYYGFTRMKKEMIEHYSEILPIEKITYHGILYRSGLYLIFTCSILSLVIVYLD